jgi:hypothetical protein
VSQCAISEKTSRVPEREGEEEKLLEFDFWNNCHHDDQSFANLI